MSDIPVDISAGAEVPADTDPFDALEGEINNLLSPPDEELRITRGQLQKMNSELANYRKKYTPIRQAFGPDAHDEDLVGLGQFYNALRSGDPNSIKGAREWINGIIDGLTPAEQAAVEAEIKEEAAETGQTPTEVAKQYTEVDINRIIDERLEAAKRAQEEQAAIQESTAKIQATAAKLGEEFGIPSLGKPGSPLYGTLMQAASMQMQAGASNIVEAMQKAAVEIITDIQAAQQAQLNRKKQTAGAGAKPVPKGGSEPVGRSERVASMEDAHANFRRRMEAAAGS